MPSKRQSEIKPNNQSQIPTQPETSSKNWILGTALRKYMFRAFLFALLLLPIILNTIWANSGAQWLYWVSWISCFSQLLGIGLLSLLFPRKFRNWLAINIGTVKDNSLLDWRFGDKVGALILAIVLLALGSIFLYFFLHRFVIECSNIGDCLY